MTEIVIAGRLQAADAPIAARTQLGKFTWFPLGGCCALRCVLDFTGIIAEFYRERL